MYIDLKKTLEEISRCLPEKGAPTPKQLQRMYELTLRLQSQELAVIYDMEAFGSPVTQEPLPYFEKAFVEIEIVTPRGSNNARVWDTSNRAIQVVLNNLKGIFFHDDDVEHMAFSVVGRWGEKGVTILHISDDKQISADQSRQVLDEKQVKS